MKPEKLYQELKDLAEKLDIKVVEKSFRNTGIKVKSGMCKVKGKNLFIMDKHISLYIKNRLLAKYLSDMPRENIYIVPAIREFINKFE